MNQDYLQEPAKSRGDPNETRLSPFLDSRTGPVVRLQRRPGLTHPPAKIRLMQALRVLLDFVQMIFAFEAFGVDLVDVFGAGRPRGEPAVLA